MSMSPRLPVEPVDDRAGALPAPASPSRRRFVRNVGLGAAALGAAAATGTALTGVASAQAAGSDAPELSGSDTALVAFLQSCLLAGREALLTAAEAPFLESPVAEMLRNFSRHHREQATAMGALLPADEAVTAPNPSLLGQVQGDVDGAADQGALLGVLLTFEEDLAATLLASLGEAQSWLVAGPISTVLPVVGQQAAAIGDAAGRPIGDWLPAFVDTEGAFTEQDSPTR